MFAETSPAGEASSDSPHDDKEFSGNRCIDCGKEYTSNKGLIGHYRSDSVDCTGVECPTCGKSYTCQNGVVKHHAKDHNEKISGVVVECEYCGEEVRKPKCRVEGTSNSFCGNECNVKYTKEEGLLSGENNPQYVNPVALECANCGESMERPPSLVSENNFCSKDCFHYFRRESDQYLSGESHPRWDGGAVDYYGPNWRRQRHRAIIRDQCRCRSCGATPTEIGRELHVHHVQPLKKFKKSLPKPDWWKEGNKMDNLVTFCPECHSKWEGITLKPQ